MSRDGKVSGSHKVVLQDAFLESMCEEQVLVTVFLVSGIKLQGVVTSFDDFCLLLKKDHITQLLYKHAISSVMPMTPFKFSVS